MILSHRLCKSKDKDNKNNKPFTKKDGKGTENDIRLSALSIVTEKDNTLLTNVFLSSQVPDPDDSVEVSKAPVHSDRQERIYKIPPLSISNKIPLLAQFCLPLLPHLHTPLQTSTLCQYQLQRTRSKSLCPLVTYPHHQ